MIEASLLRKRGTAGSSHLFFEGYFVLNHGKLASMQTLAAQLLKEYSLSDSRYLTSDRFVVPIEAVTMV
jgi:cholestenol Delta-isomerase